MHRGRLHELVALIRRGAAGIGGRVERRTRRIALALSAFVLCCGAACYDVETPPPGVVDVPTLPSDSGDDDSAGSADDDSATVGDDDGVDDDDAGDDTTSDDDGAGDDDATVDPPDPTPPPPPTFPTTIDVLTIGVRTAPTTYSGTDANTLSLCLNANTCFPMNAADVDDFRLGEMDIYTVEGVGLPRASVDRVEVRSANGDDQWEFDCLELRFDGEPVHCQDGLAVEMGNGPGELISWSDPQGVHAACDTCQGPVLTHGPILGPVTSEGATVLVRTDATRLVTLAIGAPGGPLSDVAWAWPAPEDDHFARLVVTGLNPSTTYSYAVSVQGGAAPTTGEFTTAPPEGDATELRVAFGSCAKWDEQPIFSVILDKDPDLFLFVGDNHYGNTGDLDSLRWNYRFAHSRPERRTLMQQVPTLAVWDDHDYTGNNTDGTAPGRAAALRAFEEAWPNPPGGTAGAAGIFATHSVGDVDFFLLDDRYWRGFDDSILGDVQSEWLLDRVAESTGTWKVFVLGSQWTTDGSSDSWASFPDARNQLLADLADLQVDGAIFLSGDVHRSEFRLLEVSDHLGYDAPEFTSSPLANNNTACPSETEILNCYAWGTNFLTLDFGVGAGGPEVTGSIFREGGGLEASWTVAHADLQGN